ncbi:MAG: hypothetical protein ABI120_04410 [Gemmatimonadaceae bacterium]
MLRTADEMQLAAAIITADFVPLALAVVSLDASRSAAAERDGFLVG